MRRGLTATSGWLGRLFSLTSFAVSVAFALGAVFFLVADLLEPGEGTSGVVGGLCLVSAVGVGSLGALLSLLRPADDDWTALGAAAAELRERYFDVVFVGASAEFDVWPGRRRHVRRWRVVEGLELLETGGLTEAGSSLWVGVRSRRFHSRTWDRQMSVQEAEQRVAAELDHLLAEHHRVGDGGGSDASSD